MKIRIKSLSVNEAWQGRRYKSKAYDKYILDLTRLLPKKLPIPDGKFGIHYRFGFSNPRSDYDNPIKPFQDVIAKFYGFNDSQIYKCIVEKVIVKKGEEYIEFDIFDLNTEENGA